MRTAGAGPAASRPPGEAAAAAGHVDELEHAFAALREGRAGTSDVELVEARLRPRLSRYFTSAGAAPAEVEDLVQNVLRRVFSGVRELRLATSFEPWLFTIARNVARTDGARRMHDPLGRPRPIEEADVAARAARDPDPEQRLLAGERLARVERAIATLPVQQRRCLLLRARSELSYAEIGNLLGLSPHTVRNHLAEARAALRRELGRGAEER